MTHILFADESHQDWLTRGVDANPHERTRVLVQRYEALRAAVAAACASEGDLSSSETLTLSDAGDLLRVSGQDGRFVAEFVAASGTAAWRSFSFGLAEPKPVREPIALRPGRLSLTADIAELDLSVRVVNVLKREGLTRVEKLVARTDVDFPKHIGEAALKNIDQRLSAYGLTRAGVRKDGPSTVAVAELRWDDVHGDVKTEGTR